MNTPAILSTGTEGFGQLLGDTGVTGQIVPEGKLFQSLLLQKFTGIPTSAVATPKVALAKTSTATSGTSALTTTGEQPLDVLTFLSELEAGEDGSQQAVVAQSGGTDAAGGNSTEAKLASDQKPDTATPASALDPQTMLALLQASSTTAAAAGGAAPVPSITAATPSTTDDADDATVAVPVGDGALAVDATFVPLTFSQVGSAAVEQGGGTSVPVSGSGKSPLQTLHDQFIAQEPAGSATRPESTDRADAQLARLEGSVQIFRVESTTPDPTGIALQTTQVSVQPADSSGSTPTTPTVERTISVPVGQRGWSDAVGAQVQWMVDHRVQSARLQVTPEGMGPIDVHLSVDNNNVSVNFVAQHSDTRQALEQTLPQLRAMLSSAGLSLGQATVQQQSQQSAPWTSHGDGQKRDADHSEDSPSAKPLSVGLGLVDEYA